MDNNKKQIFEDNPYWDDQNLNPSNQEDIQNSSKNVNANNGNSDKQNDDKSCSDSVNKTIPVEKKTSDIEESLPNVKVSEDETALNFVVGNVPFKMVKVQGASFTMGTPVIDGKIGKNVFVDETPAHQVTLNSFCIGETTVTQELWQAVLQAYDVSIKENKENLPKVKISWNDCQIFIKRLNMITGRKFRLPTEAEWEFAAKGGTLSKNSIYAGASRLGLVAWYSTIGKPVQPVKILKANELNIYDMSGNVSEWCNDWYGKEYYANSPENNPQGPDQGQLKVIRGGSVFSTADSCRNTMRITLDPKLREAAVGFRLALDLG